MVAAHKSTATPVFITGASGNVPIGAVAADDYGFIWVYGSVNVTPVAAGWTFDGGTADGGGGYIFVGWRKFTSSAGAGNVAVTITGSASIFGYTQLWTGAGSGLPTALTPHNPGSVSYSESPAITSAVARGIAHVAFVVGTKTMGAVSTTGTISGTHTARDAQTLSGNVISVLSSALTSASGGRVRRAFTGGAGQSLNFAYLIPEPVPVPTGFSVSGGARKFTVNPGTSTGATQYRARRRRTNLTHPGTTTQTSAPWSLAVMADGVPGGNAPYTFDGTGVVAAVPDTGLRVTHDEFTGRVETGFSAVAGQPWNTDTIGHGTAVASLVGGTINGVAKGVTILPIKVFPPTAVPNDQPVWADFPGWCTAFVSQLAGRPGVVNFSWPTPLEVGDTGYSDFATGMATLAAAGIFVTIAIGNAAADLSAETLGSAYANTLIVGGSDTSNVFYYVGSGNGSNYASWLRVIAPGEAVPIAGIASDSDMTTASGTSMSSPLVSGIAAKIKQGNVHLSPARMLEVLATQVWPVITGNPNGLTALADSTANTDDWFIRSGLSTGSQDDDGFGDAEAYEYQFGASPDGATWSDWTTSVTATTASGTTTIPVDSGAVTLTGQTPTLTGSASVVIPVDTAVLALSGTTPALAGVATAALGVEPAMVSLAGVTPLLVSPVVVAVDPASIVLVGQSPTLAGAEAASIAADLALLTLAGVDLVLAGEGAASTAVDLALLTLSGQTTSPSGAGAAAITADPGTLTLVGVTPQIDGGPIVAPVDFASLTLATASPTAAGTSSATEPVDPATLTLDGVDVTSQAPMTVVVEPALLTFTGVTAGVTGGTVGVTVDPAVLVLVGFTVVVGSQTSATVYLGDVLVQVAIGDTPVTLA